MIRTSIITISLLLLGVLSFGQPPLAPMQPVTEEYCNQLIEDQYRNLENLEDPAVREWLEKQGEYARSTLKKISNRQHFIDMQRRFDQRQSHSISWLRITKDDQYFYLKRMAGENVARLFYRKGFNGSEELLYDPKDFKPDSGNTFLINYIKPDWNGSKIAISLTKNGEEISEMVILDMTSRQLLPDLITNCWPSDGGGVSWLSDNSGFIYLHYPVIDHTSELFLKNMKAVCYRLGQNPSELNELLSNTNNPELNILPEDFPIVSIHDRADKYAFGTIAGATNVSDTYYAKLENSSSDNYDWKLLFAKEDKVSSYTILEEDLIFVTGKNASNYKICKTPLSNPDFDNPTILVSEKKDEVINSMRVTTGGIFFVTNKNGVESKLYHFKNGKEQQITLPKKSGSVYLSTKGKHFSDLWVSTMGWSSNFRRYKYDMGNNTFEAADLAPQAEYAEFKDIVVKEILVQSHDGVEVPLSIIHKEGIKMNAENPVMFYGYGAYGISMNPFFNPTLLLFVLEGGVMAIPHVRGGGEKGVEWHQGGRKTTKANTWKDLIACTEYMIQEKYTSNQRTAIWSASAGGILVGRAMTERPDLFAVAIPQVGMMNTLRSEATPNGANSTKEFGSIANPEECKALIEMDSYLHLKKGVDYPATLITAGVNDPRVIVWQPAKFAAKLQACQNGTKPILFLVDNESGHGIGDAINKQYESIADIYAFTFWQMGHPKYQMRN